MGTAKNPAWGKLGPNWEGSYRITSKAGIGAYFLEDLEVLLLISVYLINMCSLYKMFMLFILSSIKCLNLNLIMPGVLGPDDLG